MENHFSKRQWKALVIAFEFYATKQSVMESESQTSRAQLSDLINVPFVEYMHDKVFRAFHSHIALLSEHSCTSAKRKNEIHAEYNNDINGKVHSTTDENVALKQTLTTSPLMSSMPEEFEEQRHNTSKYIIMLLEFLFSNREAKSNSTSKLGNVEWAQLNLRPLTQNEINLLALCYRTQVKMQTYYNKLVSENTNVHGTHTYHRSDLIHNNTHINELNQNDNSEHSLQKSNRKEEQLDARQHTSDNRHNVRCFNKQEEKRSYVSKVNNNLVENKISKNSKRSITDVDDNTDDNMEHSQHEEQQQFCHNNSNEYRNSFEGKSNNGHNYLQPIVPQEQLICEVCHESGGDLYLCSQCRRWMHEICGGPHPPEASNSLTHSRKSNTHCKINEENHTMRQELTKYSSLTSLCKQCRVEMRMTSSSSSSSEEELEEESECELSSSLLTHKKLRKKASATQKRKRKRSRDSKSSSSLCSSTSSSERAELDAYFGSDDDSDTSLSGFIVRSSEDDDDNEDDELTEWEELEEVEQKQKESVEEKHEKRNNDTHNKLSKGSVEQNKNIENGSSKKRAKDTTSPEPSSLSSSSIAPLSAFSTQSFLEMADDIL